MDRKTSQFHKQFYQLKSKIKKAQNLRHFSRQIFFQNHLLISNSNIYYSLQQVLNRIPQKQILRHFIKNKKFLFKSPTHFFGNEHLNLRINAVLFYQNVLQVMVENVLLKTQEPLIFRIRSLSSFLIQFREMATKRKVRWVMILQLNQHKQIIQLVCSQLHGFLALEQLQFWLRDFDTPKYSVFGTREFNPNFDFEIIVFHLVFTQLIQQNTLNDLVCGKVIFFKQYLVFFVRYEYQTWLIHHKIYRWLVQQKLNPNTFNIYNYDLSRQNIQLDEFQFVMTTQYGNKFCSILPSRPNIRLLFTQIRNIWKLHHGKPAYLAIQKLNKFLISWCSVYAQYYPNKILKKFDFILWKQALRFGKRTHPKKSTDWVIRRYFRCLKMDNKIIHLVFSDLSIDNKIFYLRPILLSKKN